MTPDQMKELAARLREWTTANRYRSTEAEFGACLAAAADLIDSMAQAEPVAWLHDVTRGSDDDQALSFSPDNFPLQGLFRSVGHRPLYLAPPAREPLTEQQIWDAVEHGAIGGIGLVSKAVKVARAVEQAHDIRSDK